MNPAAAVLSTGIVVFREGLEAILVLAAITAGLSRAAEGSGKKIALGVGLALGATMVTWFLVVSLIAAVNAPELQIQAVTGLFAILVLIIVMNWFFHRVYWTGWISHHGKRLQRLLSVPDEHSFRSFGGFALLGFTAVYREGFEVVIFLQNLRLEAGMTIVLIGATIGVLLTSVVAVLTFLVHRHLAYKKSQYRHH